MAYISVHDPKQEWECDDQVDARVYFLVSRDCIFVYYSLEYCCEFIRLKVSRRFKLLCSNLLDLEIVLASRSALVICTDKTDFGSVELFKIIFSAHR